MQVECFLTRLVESLDAGRFQVMSVRRNRFTIYDVLHKINLDTLVLGWIKQWLRYGGCGTVLRYDINLWLAMPFLRCTEGRGYIVRVAEFLAQYIGVLPNNLPVESLYFIAFNRPFYRLHVYIHFHYRVKDPIFERRLKACGDSRSFLKWHCVGVHRIPPLVSSTLFVPVPGWWYIYDCICLLLELTRIVVQYCSNLLIGRRAPALCFLFQSPSSVLTVFFLFFLLQFLVDLFVSVVTLQVLKILLHVEYLFLYVTVFTTFCGPSDLFGLSPNAVSILWEFFLPLAGRWKSTGFMKAASVGILTSLQLRSLAIPLSALFFPRNWATDMFFITCRNGDVPVKLGRYRLRTKSEMRSAAGTAGVQVDEPLLLLHFNISWGFDDRSDGHAEPIWDSQDFRNLSVGTVSALQQVQSLLLKVGLDAPTTFIEAQILIAQKSGLFLRIRFFGAPTAGCNDFKPEKETLQSDVKKSKNGLFSPQSNAFAAKLEELRRTYDDDMHVLEQKLRKSEQRAHGVHFWADLQWIIPQKTKDFLRSDIAS